MSITVNGRSVRRLVGSQNNVLMETIHCAFSTTDANGTIPTQLKVIEGYSYGWVGTPAADEILSLDETTHQDAKDNIVVASKVVTAKRTAASKTSGLKFFLQLWGY